MITEDENIVRALQTLATAFFDGPEGMYNEHSLAYELINHFLGRPVLSKEEWFESYRFWERFVRHTLEDDDDELWTEYLEGFFDRMDRLYDFATLILV